MKGAGDDGQETCAHRKNPHSHPAVCLFRIQRQRRTGTFRRSKPRSCAAILRAALPGVNACEFA